MGAKKKNKPVEQKLTMFRASILVCLPPSKHQIEHREIDLKEEKQRFHIPGVLACFVNKELTCRIVRGSS